MKKAGEKGAAFVDKGPKNGNQVSEDQNWRINVKNELKSVDQWSEDWSFLVQHGNRKQLLDLNSL